MKKIILVLLALTLTAFASSRGFDRGSLRSQITEARTVTELNIQKVLELKPQLPEPFTLAVYFPPSQAAGYYGRNWN